LVAVGGDQAGGAAFPGEEFGRIGEHVHGRRGTAEPVDPAAPGGVSGAGEPALVAHDEFVGQGCGVGWGCGLGGVNKRKD
jgi:hypothetical protein